MGEAGCNPTRSEKTIPGFKFAVMLLGKSDVKRQAPVISRDITTIPHEIR